jgi:predicted nucleotidyltransferase component of viral defense system
MTANIKIGHIARHTPKGAGVQGREAAIIDIAQDLLLVHLKKCGILDRIVFKGGTSLRKLYAGNSGRFSLDLDFSICDIYDNPEDILAELIDEIDGLQFPPFSYGVSERRGKWSMTYQHPFGQGDNTLQSKLDLNPPPWLPPVQRSWVPMPIHAQYGEIALPMLTVVRLEENIAEKIARLNRTTTARDMYDLRWIMTNQHIVGKLDTDLIRRLAVLKIWCDANGVHGGHTYWKTGHECSAFHPGEWLRDRSKGEFDLEDIGALTTPPPTAKELSDAVSSLFSFLTALDKEEQIVASIKEQDRPLVLQMLANLPGNRLDGIGLY